MTIGPKKNKKSNGGEHKMVNDRQITITTGNSRKDLNWKQQTLLVSELYERLSHVSRGTETLQEYTAMKKTQQDALKDVGGFVGGSLNGPRRKAAGMTGRDLVTLDFDNVPGWKTDDIVGKVELLGCSYCVYSTRKHTAAKPRLRVVIPLDQTVTPEEYEPVARRIAAHIGIDMADPTTFEACRLMYWPSCCKDSEFVFKTKDAPLVSAQFLLDTYVDWRDITSWPQTPGAAATYKRLAMKQGDPTQKPGIVGVFCRTYDITSAIDTFLPGIYDEVEGMSDRYTYLNGSTTGGAVLYENGQFLFSHHATDPCGGKLVNAFDLVRLHKFGELDENCDAGTPVNRLPSYAEMNKLALADKQVSRTMSVERQAQVAEDFQSVAAGSVSQGQNAEADEEWAAKLKRDQNGRVLGTINNVLIILDGDTRLKGRFALNKFTYRGEVLAQLPWEAAITEAGKRRMWSDTDSNGLYWYLETAWGITQRGAIDAALDLHAALHAFNDVQDYLNRLEWDGTKRLDTLFIDYLGAEDTEYNRAVCRKTFTAAVARAMNPGCKFDTMLILAGPQGIGKSTLLDRMSRGWFNDSIRSFEGKDASELLQGVWLVEIAELDAFRRTEVSRIKQFITQRVDRYRAAYARNVREMPRCCVFFGTTNTLEFLTDTTGNRRFWPVDVGKTRPAKKVWKDLTPEVVDQLWAEAKMRWAMAESLVLEEKMEQEATAQQELHREASYKEGLIRDFLAKQVPDNWSQWPLDRRRDYWAGTVQSLDGGTPTLVDRDRVSAIEIWCELFNGHPRELSSLESRLIRMILASFEEWEVVGNAPSRNGPYGLQRCFWRKKE